MSDPIAALRSNRGLSTPAEVRAFDDALAALADAPDPAQLAELLAVFTDATAAHEVMWGLVHLVEDFDVRAQLDAMLPALPAMEVEAPEWVRLLHYRILNHAPSRAAYAEVLAAAGNRGQAARAVLEEIARQEEEPLRSAARAVLDGG